MQKRHRNLYAASDVEIGSVDGVAHDPIAPTAPGDDFRVDGNRARYKMIRRMIASMPRTAEEVPANHHRVRLK